MSSNPQTLINPAIRDEAAGWVVRRDRGFSEAEAAEFERWLQADQRHAAAMARSALAWSILDRVPASVVTGPKGVNLGRWIAAAGLIAAAFSVAYLAWRQPENKIPASVPARAAVTQVTGPEVMTLTDGTTVLLNAGSEVVEQFTPGERRVELVRGEAHFAVTKNPARPFIVRAGTVKVRAVGTAFDVNLQTASVEVLVTEGRVRVDAENRDRQTEQGAGNLSGDSFSGPVSSPQLVAGQRAVVALAPAPAASGITVSEMNQEEQARALAWMTPLLRLGGATLAELAVEFQKRTGHRLILADSALADMRIGGRFRADDIEGFVRVLENNYGLVAERRNGNETVLRRK